MDNRKLIALAGAGALALIVLLAVLLFWPDHNAESPTMLPDHQFENWDQPLANESALSEEALSMFDQEGMLSFEALLEAARKGEISLISELWRLRRQCPEGMSRFDCNIRIRQFLMQKFPPPGNEALTEMFRNYLNYEEAMARLQLPEDMSLADRYKLIREKRREIFGVDDAKLLFGLEEAKFDYNRELPRFMEQSQNMNGDARIAAYESMRKKVYGDYYAAVVAREPPFDRYSTEIELRDRDLAALDADKRSAALQDMRTQYFGEAGAERMAAVDRMLAEEKERASAYEKAEAEFLAQNASLNPEERERKLRDLRVRLLGEEEAAAYERREAYRKTMEKMNQPGGSN